MRGFRFTGCLYDTYTFEALNSSWWLDIDTKTTTTPNEGLTLEGKILGCYRDFVFRRDRYGLRIWGYSTDPNRGVFGRLKEHNSFRTLPNYIIQELDKIYTNLKNNPTFYMDLASKERRSVVDA